MSHSFAIGDIIQGKYEVKAVLGTGGMGTVYRARQIDLGRDVAIKVPNPQALEIPGFLQRFSREARLVAKLTHDNIVQVYEYNETPDGIFIVMEYVEGQDLKAMIMRPPADLTVKDLATILRSTCEGLNHAHEAGIVHRDIKPHNIMVEQRARGKWRVKIMDFGIAHADANANLTMMNQEQLTVTGQAIGTPSYMSPEQIRGSGVSAKSDIYSMGCVIFYSFTRTTPFQGTGFTVAASHLSDAPPMIKSRAPSLPDEAETVVLQCLEKDPELRPVDASELGQSLYESLTPIFETRMAEIWPSAENAGGGTDVLKQTRPIPDAISSQKTQTDGPPQRSSKSAVRPTDQQKIPGVRNVTQTMPPRGGNVQPAEKTQAQTGITGATGHTIPYQDPAVGAAAAGVEGVYDEQQQQEAVPSPPRKNLIGIAAAFLIPLLAIGIGLGYYIVHNRSTKTNGTGSGGTEIATNTNATHPTNGLGTPEATPAATAKPTAAPTATVTPSPSPRPTPTPDPVLARVDALKKSFADSKNFDDRSHAWQQAVVGSDAKDSRIAALAATMAMDIAREPELKAIPAGRFTMGSPDGEGEAEEHPQNNVSYSAYQIGKFEVTALEFATYLNDIGPEEAAKIFKPNSQLNIQLNSGTKKYEPAEGKYQHPANGISWNAAVAYAEWLSLKTGDKYRLPTEAEWENAARAGSSQKYPWGDAEPGARQAQFNSAAAGTVTVLDMPAGRNSWELAHMAGNVAEWCQDWYDDHTYGDGDRNNPRGPETPPTAERRPRKVVRGGSFQSPSSADIRNAKRDRIEPDKTSPDIGFRLVREPKSL